MGQNRTNNSIVLADRYADTVLTLTQICQVWC